MAATVEIPFPPRREEPRGSPIDPPWVAIEPRWEYQEVVRDLATEGLLTEAELNRLGNDHWELAGIVRENHRAHFYFKRERLR